jgi:small subunit ribosomal protein S16
VYLFFGQSEHSLYTEEKSRKQRLIWLTKFAKTATLVPMLKIRLKRIGRKNVNDFRIVVTDHKNAARRGVDVEIVGHYNPRNDKDKKVDADRVKYWISKGAQVSDTVHNFLVASKVIPGKKVNALPKKTAPKKVEAAAPAAEAPKAEPTPEVAPAA